MNEQLLIKELENIEFDKLCTEVSECQKCERMCDSRRVLNRSVGSLQAPIMFIGEAPGRLGADGSEIPFHGDKAGHNFEELLEFAGITRSSIFVTNAVLCNPKDEKGNNSTPTAQEIKNCSEYLKKQVEIVNPKIVVTIGATALAATSLIDGHEFNLKQHVRTANSWFGRILIPLYHPGQRAMLHRSFANQRSDYKFVSDQFKKLFKNNRKIYGSTARDVASIVNYILGLKPSITYFALHKLFYLIEYNYSKEFQKRLTTAYFIRQKDGPYCTDLHLAKLKKAIPSIEIKNTKGDILLNKKSQLFLFENEQTDFDLSQIEMDLISQIVEKYSAYSNSRLKTVVYLTDPMKVMLRLEKNKLINLYNAPIHFF